MLNRVAIILRYKESAIRWINEADPIEHAIPIKAADVNKERTVYLISDLDGESDKTVERWLRRNWKELFEQELMGWYTVPSLWPKKRTFKLFREWFDIECHTVLVDTVGTEVLDDGL